MNEVMNSEWMRTVRYRAGDPWHDCTILNLDTRVLMETIATLTSMTTIAQPNGNAAILTTIEIRIAHLTLSGS